MHVFECVEPVETMAYRIDQGPQSITVAQLLREKHCMICTTVAAATREKLCLSSSGDTERAADLRVRNCGPYHVHLAPYGLSKIEEKRKGSKYHSSRSTREMVKMRCVCLVLVCVDPEGWLRDNQVPSSAAEFAAGSRSMFKFGRDRPWPDCTLELQLDLEYAAEAAGLLSVQRWNSPRYCTPSTLRQFIDTCVTQADVEHHQCVSLADTVPEGFRVIDVHELCVVKPFEPRPRFVALSYAWKDSPGDKFSALKTKTLAHLSEPGSLNVHKLPEVIWDSIVLCQDLGEKYLWVDRLCIVQDNAVAKQGQINGMNSIYRNAVVIIVAAVDHSLDVGLPGVWGHPRRNVSKQNRNFGWISRRLEDNRRLVIDNSTWNTRGWTLQERLLSRRCIYVTNHQTYYVCSTIWCDEEMDRVSFSAAGHEATKLSLMVDFLYYTVCVEQYSRRILSYDEDIMNAFVGISNEL